MLTFVKENRLDADVEILALPDTFISHGSVEYQERITGIDAQELQKVWRSIEKKSETGEQQ